MQRLVSVVKMATMLEECTAEETHIQRLVSVVKMATMLESVLLKRSILLRGFCWQKDSMKRLFIKKCFLFEGEVFVT
jgi:hypothetical protein